MGIIGKVMRSLIEDSIREIITEVYDGYTKQSPIICPAGIDSIPIEGDQGIMLKTDNNGQSYFIGVYPKATAESGETRLYSRSADGTQKSEIHLKNDGKVSIKNNNFEISGTDTGVITITNSVGAKIEMDIAGLFAIKNNAASLNTVLTNLITALSSGVIDPSTFMFNAATLAALNSVLAQLNLLTKA